MSHAATLPEERAPGTPPPAAPPLPAPAEIRTQLRAILASPSFHGSRRCQQFLEYVCTKALEGDPGALKERAVAVEVFGRHPDSGLGEDTIVRVGAREVRKRLAQFYSSPEGANAPVVIELPLGSYLPEFRFSARPTTSEPPSKPVPTSIIQLPPAAPDTVPAATPAIPATHSARSRRPLWFAAATILLLAAAALAAWKWRSANSGNPAFETFWGPVLNTQTPLLIGVGHPIVYMPSHRAALLNEKRLPPTPYPVQRPLSLAPKELDGSDIVAVQNQFIGFGDMVAANDISQMLARRGHNVRVLLATSIPFADLRNAPTYLIGSLSNRWTSELSQTWRYRFIFTPEHVPVIEDTQSAGHQPSGHKQWTVPAKDDGSTPEDYCLIARIPNSPTGGLLIVSAGIKQFGTEAAGRLLADPADLAAILAKLPPGWETKNVELVLHARVIGNTPAQPELVASHVW